jgi:hypothetical protein
MMVAVVCCLAALSGNFEDVKLDYDGPAYACRCGTPDSFILRVKGEVLMLCVGAGMGPAQVSSLFGLPWATSGFRTGPTEWFYGDMKVSVFFPLSMFPRSRSTITPERVSGTIQ